MRRFDFGIGLTAGNTESAAGSAPSMRTSTLVGWAFLDCAVIVNLQCPPHVYFGAVKYCCSDAPWDKDENSIDFEAGAHLVRKIV